MQELTLDTVFGRLAGLRSGGRGRRVLALHGWLDNAASFVPLQPWLERLDLVALDLPGHGASAHLPPAAEFTVVNAARAAFAAADALGWERFALLGHSLGAAVASVMAAAMPQRIDRLLAIEALGALAGDEQRSAQRLQDAFAAAAVPARTLRVFADPAAAVRARVRAGGIGESAARLIVERGIAPARGGDGRPDGGPPGFTWRSDPRLTRPTAVRMSEAQVRNLLVAIECPVRVIYANPAQEYFPETLRRERFAYLRHGELIELDGGHHVHMEAPEKIAAAIGDFL